MRLFSIHLAYSTSVSSTSTLSSHLGLLPPGSRSCAPLCTLLLLSNTPLTVPSATKTTKFPTSIHLNPLWTALSLQSPLQLSPQPSYSVTPRLQRAATNTCKSPLYNIEHNTSRSSHKSHIHATGPSMFFGALISPDLFISDVN